MEKKTKEYNRYTVLDAFKCFFWLLIVTALVSLVMQIVVLIIAKSTGQVYAELIESEDVLLVSCILSPVSMIAFFFIYNAIRKVKNREAITDGEKVSLLPISISIVLAIICIFLFTPFMNLITILFESSGYVVDNTLPLQAKMTTDTGYFFLGLFIFALLPAIAEELIFRGIIQTSLSTRYKGFTTIIISTLLFVLMHGSLNQTIYQFVVGIMLSYLALVGGSIIYSIILHFLNNALVVVFSCFDIVSYLSASEAVYYNIFSMIFPFTIFLLGVSLVAILFWVLKYLRNKNFFRLDEHGKFITSDKEAVAKINASKVGFKSFFSSMTYNEKIYSIVSFIIIAIIWISNTITGFM